MQVFANIASPLERKTSNAGRVFFKTRVAEHSGRGDDRKPTWYTVVAFIDEVHADMLHKGQFVKIGGRLEVEAFIRKDGTPGVELTIVTSSIVPVETKAEQPA